MRTDKKFLAQAQETRAMGQGVAVTLKKGKRHLILRGPSEAQAPEVAPEATPA